MKLYIYISVGMLAMAGPSHALLAAKLALLGILRNSILDGGNAGGVGNGGGYGYSSGYGGGYGGSYGSGSYGNGGYGLSYNRPVYTGQSSNYGWGQRNYGGGYSVGYNGGNEDNVRVIKVIVNHEQPDSFYNNYARSSSASAASVSSLSGGNWAPVPAPAPAPAPIPQPIPQTYSVQPIPVSAPTPAPLPLQVQTSIPAATVSSSSGASWASAPIPQTYTVQPVQVTAPIQAPVPVQVIQPPPRPVYISSQPQSGYQQVSVQRPIQYPVQQQPQSTFRQVQTIPQPLPQSQGSVSTIKLIVDGDSQHVPAVSYGPAIPSPGIVAPGVGNSDAWNLNSFSSSSNSGRDWNNVGSGPRKSGGIWESVGC